jgi:Family of unknown function (DUF5678)
MNMQLYLKNRRRFSYDELDKHAGKYVAWSPDGTRIIASADDLSALCAAVDASEFDPAEVVMEPVPFPDEVVLGGGLDP